ncbi:phosphatidylinositol-specific phospholipase C [Xylariaceae sp. FL0255]|nr:phosphatidylinositol-specific phospholipase C [Xylariaceae sp. FL0255]
MPKWHCCCFSSTEEQEDELLCHKSTMADSTAAVLTIRNLTATPLELKVVELFDGHPTNDATAELKKSSSFTQKIKIFNSNKSDTVSPAIKVDNPGPKDLQDVSVPISCFETLETEIRAPEPGREALRLTFECDGYRYQGNVPTTSQRSTVMTRLDGAPNEYTIVYVQAEYCVSIFSSSNLSCWMRELRDDYPLTAFSIPGTHNSPTCHVALPSVRCQAVGIRQQLENGVRFFDIRVNVNKDNADLTLVHSAFPISLTGSKYFKELIDVVYSYLDTNPSETLIMSIKREGTGRGTDQRLSKLLKEKYGNDAKRWYTEPRIPKLGEVRGRIILLRRHVNDKSLDKEWEGRGWGLDASSWPDNCEDELVGSGIARVQDFYEIDQSTNIQKKINFARKHLERAAEGVCHLPDDKDYDEDAPPTPFFINFLSASNFFRANCWPEKIAAKVNPAIIEYLCLRHGRTGRGPAGLEVGDATTGIVVTDWVGLNGDWDLIRCIVGWNAKLQLKQ